MKGFITFDVFNIDNDMKNKKYYDFCFRVALKCGLYCRKFINKDSYPTLELRGTKIQFIKYYLYTLLKCKRKQDGVIRFLNTLMW